MIGQPIEAVSVIVEHAGDNFIRIKLPWGGAIKVSLPLSVVLAVKKWYDENNGGE
jgi:hypothetical protein